MVVDGWFCCRASFGKSLQDAGGQVLNLSASGFESEIKDLHSFRIRLLLASFQSALELLIVNGYMLELL